MSRTPEQSGSGHRVLDLWLPFFAAGNFETDGGGILVVVEGNAGIAGVSGPQRVYVLVAFLCFCWLKQKEEEPTIVEKHSRIGYIIAAPFSFFLFADNLLRHIEGQGWKGFWPCSGRLEVVVLFGTLCLLAQFAYWSRIVSGLNQQHA